jgi:hypothetical protein
MTPVQKIFAAVAELERAYPGRSFTPDGIMVGSLGEVRAAEVYDIVLHPPNTPDHDAEDTARHQIQIRTNQGDAAYLKKEPDYLLALKLLKNSEIEEIYNGPGTPAWKLALEVKADPNGYHAVRHSKLRRLMVSIPVEGRIKKK